MLGFSDVKKKNEKFVGAFKATGTQWKKKRKMASAKGGLLARSDFPLYAVKSLDERHFLVAGGGGAAKTGIANAIVRNV